MNISNKFNVWRDRELKTLLVELFNYSKCDVFCRHLKNYVLLVITRKRFCIVRNITHFRQNFTTRTYLKFMRQIFFVSGYIHFVLDYVSKHQISEKKRNNLSIYQILPEAFIETFFLLKHQLKNAIYCINWFIGVLKIIAIHCNYNIIEQFLKAEPTIN